MTKLDAKARDALPDSAFAYIDSKGNRFLPIHDAIHVRDAMSRWSQTDFESPAKKASARSKILAAAKRFGIDVSSFANPLESAFATLMAKVAGKKAEMSNVTLEATFAVESEEEDGDDLILKGRLFKSGDYPDKNFSLTPIEMHRAIQQFVAPKYMNLHHQKPLFKKDDSEEELDLTGEFGVIENVWTDDDGEWLKAKVRKPKWLHQFCPEQKVSAEFSYSTKDLKAAAWTHDPRIPEAELVAAFANSRHNTQNGQMALQQIHDTAARSGAVCDRANMASKHEATAIQRIHDMSANHGATCQSMQPGQAMPIATYANDKRPRSKRMNMKEFLLGKAKEEGYEVDENDPMFAHESDPAVAEMQAKLKAAEDRAAALEAAQTQHAATFARMESESRQSAAATFAKDQVVAGRISPAAQEPLAALTVRILEADSTAKFAEGEKSNAVLLREVLDALESDFKIFTKNTVGDDAGPFAALFAETKTKGVGTDEVTQADLDKILAATPDGQAILAARKNHA